MDNTKYVIYAFFWLPVTPACCLFAKIVTNPRYLLFMDLTFLDTKVLFVVLLLNIPLWVGIYLYLDSVMPSEYGTNKHPCFCFRRSEKRERHEVQDDADLENKSRIYSAQDPIRLEGLTKNFGSFTAVKNLKFSIK